MSFKDNHVIQKLSPDVGDALVRQFDCAENSMEIGCSDQTGDSLKQSTE